MSFNISNWPYFAIILVLLLLAGGGEYAHLIPPGTFGNLLLVAVGLIAPSPLVHPAPAPATPAQPPAA